MPRKVLLFVFLFSVTRENYGKLEGAKVQDKIPAVRKRINLNFVGNTDLEISNKISTNAHLSLYPAFLNCFVFFLFQVSLFFAPDPLMPASKFGFRK